MNYQDYKNEDVIVYHSQAYGFEIEKSTKLFNKLKEFLSDCSNSNANPRPTKEIDLIWHSFLLHTMEYEKFCNKYFNKFIHHTPETVKYSDDLILKSDLHINADSMKLADCRSGDS